jgi:hypothetical protein
MWTNFPDIEKVWGVPLEFLEGRVTVHSPPGKDTIGKQIAELLQTEIGISNVKLGTDRGAITDEFGAGLLIPPGYQ